MLITWQAHFVHITHRPITLQISRCDPMAKYGYKGSLQCLASQGNLRSAITTHKAAIFLASSLKLILRDTLTHGRR